MFKRVLFAIVGAVAVVAVCAAGDQRPCPRHNGCSVHVRRQRWFAAVGRRGHRCGEGGHHRVPRRPGLSCFMDTVRFSTAWWKRRRTGRCELEGMPIPSMIVRRRPCRQWRGRVTAVVPIGGLLERWRGEGAVRYDRNPIEQSKALTETACSRMSTDQGRAP